jgi:hypothetical protein
VDDELETLLGVVGGRLDQEGGLLDLGVGGRQQPALGFDVTLSPKAA